MIGHAHTQVSAFAAERRIAAGRLDAVIAATWPLIAAGQVVLLLDDESGHPVEVDWRGSEAEVMARLPVEAPRGPGRPKLGVTAREVTLLPRHWDWLAAQPGGASVALRKLVETASRDGRAQRKDLETKIYRHLSTLAGDQAGFEDASRALFAGDHGAFEDRTRNWPPDIRDHARRQAARLFDMPDA